MIHALVVLVINRISHLEMTCRQTRTAMTLQPQVASAVRQFLIDSSRRFLLTLNSIYSLS